MLIQRVTSVTQKNVPSAVVYYYRAWYIFLCYRRYKVIPLKGTTYRGLIFTIYTEVGFFMVGEPLC